MKTVKTTAFHKLQFGVLAAALLLVLLLVALSPVASAALLVAQLVLMAAAGGRVADLVFGDVTTAPDFVAAVGGLLVMVSLIGGWWGALAYPAAYLSLLQACGLVLLVLPWALPRRVRGA